jgi:hypothetical protein
MSFLKTIPILLILPLLNGCISGAVLEKSNREIPHPLTDKVYHVEKAVISKDQRLVIYLEGSLANSSQRSQFTVSVPLYQIRNAEAANFQYETNKDTYYNLTVSRDAIHSDWMPQDDNLEIVPIGQPIPTPSEKDGLDYHYYAFGEYANLLPNSTKTLYPIIERRVINSKGWPAELEFMYVDDSIKHKYTIIGVKPSIAYSQRNSGLLFLLPVTIPLDIAASPFYLLLVGLECSGAIPPVSH